MSDAKQLNDSERKTLNMDIIRAKKALALIIVIFGPIFILQLFQIGPWTFQPSVKWPYLTYIDDPRYNLGITCGTPRDYKLTLLYGETDDLDGSIKETKATTLHEFELRNLKADTKYYWKLTCSDKNLKLPYLDIIKTFRTAPNPSDDKPFKISIIGDTRPNFFGMSRFPQLMNLMLEENPDFMINVGDIVMGPGFSYQWDRFFWDIRRCADIGSAYMIGLGNHEWNEWTYWSPPDEGKTYGYYMNYPHKENYYAFNYSNVAFISIDNNEGEITDTQLEKVEAWLDAANRSSDIDWIIVYGHYPLYSAGGRSNRVGDKFEDLFINYNVDMYLSGHVHYYARSKINDITYIVAGGGGAELNSELTRSDHVISSAVVFQYCNIEIDANQLKFESISDSGVIIDECKLEPRK